MKMIDILNLMAEGKIKNDAKLIAITDSDDYEYRYSEGYHRFFNKYSNVMEDDFYLDEDFLNIEVELTQPKPKKYLIKVNVHGLHEDFAYLNYFERINRLSLHDKDDYGIYKTHFTKDELKSIKPVKEFLDDMQGKFELIEADDNE